ncbi:acyl-CoA N-acyltransferase [Cercophora samala]|uniref:Acyl-CoA N-acyltransferase n=1 Tax=Cercophora samala TaxID=330535 RepID=A0AA39ZGU6_9PEZI|nr:acyl-CoA N-acyltransferase [Cercophora samala]
MSPSQETPESLPKTPPPPILTFTPKPHTTLQIRPFHPPDAPQVARVANSPRIASCMRNTFPHPYNLQDAQYWINLATTSFSHPATKPTKSGQPLLLAYAIILDGVLVGDIGLKPLWDIESETFEIGYWLGEQFWGAGIMTAVLKEFIAWTWEQFPTVRRLEAMVFDFNEGSKRVLTRAGFVQEGVKREAVRKGDKICDMIVFGLLRREWTTQTFSISVEP